MLNDEDNKMNFEGFNQLDFALYLLSKGQNRASIRVFQSKHGASVPHFSFCKQT